MRIIFLNIWQGKLFKKFKGFLLKESFLTDIFCFQEVSPQLFLKISKILVNFKGSHVFRKEYYPSHLGYGHAIFIKKNLKIISFGKKPIFEDKDNMAGFMQYLSLEVNAKTIFLGNVHGAPHPGNKLDTELRLNQSEEIIKYFKNKKGPIIFGGDFNLLPWTESIKMFEKAGYRNMVKEFNIEKTRNELSWEVHSKEKEYFEKQYFADYVFVSPEIKVNDFKVPDIEISDHLPMILNFDI